MVEALIGFGANPATIGQLMDPPCGEDTIRKNYPGEITNGAVVFRHRLEATLATMALGQPEIRAGKRILQKAVAPDKASLFFLLKTRYGYREVNKTEHSFDGLDIGSLTEAQLAQLIERLDRALATRGSEPAEADTDGSDSEVHSVRH